MDTHKSDYDKRWRLANAESIRIKRRQYYLDNREHSLMTSKQYNIKLRNEVILEYGGKCVCCSINEPEFLSIDHVFNDGVEHRKIIGLGSRIYRWLRKNNFPKGRFQLLCFNCNAVKGAYGACLHLTPIVLTSKQMSVYRLKQRIIAAYGGQCKCCGEFELPFLSVDHINGGGKKHRQQCGGGSNFYYWLQRNNYPPGFQVLCHNCNHTKGSYGMCPHQKVTE